MSQIVLQGLSAHVIAELSERLGEPSWLRDFRLKAYEQFEKLPVEQSSLYSKYVDLRGVDFSSINLQPQLGKQAAANFVEKIRRSRKGHTQVQLDSATAEAELPADLKGIGVRFGNIVTAIREDPNFFQPYFLEKAIMPHEDKLAALNCALFTSGVFLYVPKGIAVSLPFRNVSVLNEPRGSAISHTIIIADAGSQVTVLDELYTTDESIRQPSLHSSIVEIYARDGAEARYGGINAPDDEKICLSNKRSIGDRDSRVSWAIGYFGGKLTKSKMDMVLKGTGASADDNEIIFGSGSEHFDIATNILHKGTNTSGQAHGKCVLKEKSRAIMKGLIVIEENAKNSSAYLAEHAMLLSPDARADAIPGLEIACNEVKATHSASVSQLNEEQVFYLLTRGLSEPEAKKMLIGGFFEPVMRQVGVLEVRGRIRALVEKKWENQTTADLATRDVGAEIEQELEVFEGRKDIFEGHYKYR